MQKIYPEGTREALEVFLLYEATGEFFDISNPEHIKRGSITIGNPVEIKQSHCLHCGRCAEVCPKQNIKKVGQI